MKKLRRDILTALLLPPGCAMAVVFVASPLGQKFIRTFRIPFLHLSLLSTVVGWLLVTMACCFWLAVSLQKSRDDLREEGDMPAHAGAIGCGVFLGQFVLGLAIIFFGCAAIR